MLERYFLLQKHGNSPFLSYISGAKIKRKGNLYNNFYQ